MFSFHVKLYQSHGEPGLGGAEGRGTIALIKERVHSELNF